MKRDICSILLFLVTGCTMQPGLEVDENQPVLGVQQSSVLAKSTWIHGSEDCDTNMDGAHDVYKHDEQTIIIRQNKCLTFEAPFIYVLVGQDKVLVLDTGALSDSPEHSLVTVIESALGKEVLSSKEVLVVHSHGHSDHYQGDAYFDVLPNVELIKPTEADVHQYFKFTDWPQGQSSIDLGGRLLTVIPTPGHHEEGITLYDPKTKWLLTGDTLYPGYIYVKDWDSYRNSIDKLDAFTSHNEVSAIMGAHIEMSNQPGSYYPIGSTYQPNEAALDLSVESLHRLNAELKVRDKATELVFDDFVIHPMSGFQKTLSNTVRWFTQ